MRLFIWAILWGNAASGLRNLWLATNTSQLPLALIHFACFLLGMYCVRVMWNLLHRRIE